MGKKIFLRFNSKERNLNHKAAKGPQLNRATAIVSKQKNLPKNRSFYSVIV